MTAAAWSEADVALAQAVQADMRAAASLAKLRRAAARAKTPPVMDAAIALEEEMFALRQSLTRAAKQRGLTLVGQPGDEARYDARRHRPVRGEVERGAPVRVIVPGVSAGDRVLAPAEVRRMRKTSS